MRPLVDLCFAATMKIRLIDLQLSVLLLIAAIAADQRSYAGYKLIRAWPKSISQVNKLQQLSYYRLELDFWTEPSVYRPVDINIPPEIYLFIRVYLTYLGVGVTVLQENTQRLLDQSHPTRMSGGSGVLQSIMETLGYKRSTQNIVETFPRYQQLMDWLEYLGHKYPEIASYEDIGETYEGRIQRLFKIGRPSLTGDIKPIIWIDSAIHAREWISIGTSLWIINRVLTTHDSDPKTRFLLEKFDWYFLPLVNADGYEYTHTTDRLWRKTRSLNPHSDCIGTDANRNWQANWGVSGTDDVCSDSYAGSAPFSEACTSNMARKLTSISSRVKVYVALHAYAQMWLVPYAYKEEKPTDYSNLMRMANTGEAALHSKHNTSFAIGTSPDLLYSCSGTAFDWVHLHTDIPYSYALELRPDHSTSRGFIIDQSEIEPSGQEVWAGLAAIAHKIYEEL